MSTRFKPAARTYVRPMAGWWRKNPYFVRYMIREASAVFLTLYALILLTGLSCLSIGEDAYDGWLRLLASPPSVLFHIVALVLVCYHSVTWFEVMPKTMPSLPVAAKLIPVCAIAAVVCLSVLILAVLR